MSVLQHVHASPILQSPLVLPSDFTKSNLGCRLAAKTSSVNVTLLEIQILKAGEIKFAVVAVQTRQSTALSVRHSREKSLNLVSES